MMQSVLLFQKPLTRRSPRSSEGRLSVVDGVGGEDDGVVVCVSSLLVVLQ